MLTPNLLYRIIEIAGGREIYSQSRSKAVRKSRNIGNGDETDKKKNSKSPNRQGVWELRGRCNDLKKHRNSHDFTETVFSSEVCSLTHNQEPSRSPENETKVTSPTNMAMPGEVVVFDDIGDNWHDEKEKRMEEERSNNVSPYNHATATSIFNTGDPESLERVTKVIGNLPIAVYEGSPRRYGPRQVESNCSHPQLPSAQSLLASPSVYPPRPGFPQRVVCTPSDNEPTSNIDHSNYNVSTVDL